MRFSPYICFSVLPCLLISAHPSSVLASNWLAKAKTDKAETTAQLHQALSNYENATNPENRNRSADQVEELWLRASRNVPGNSYYLGPKALHNILSAHPIAQKHMGRFGRLETPPGFQKSNFPSEEPKMNNKRQNRVQYIYIKARDTFQKIYQGVQRFMGKKIK